MDDSTDDRRPEPLDERRTTDEVGDEGGGSGNVEVEADRVPTVGREEHETGSGRRHP